MALTDQPYLPLYVRDWLSNLKLKTCKAESHGILISIMCLMHLSDDYGRILLNQKFKQYDQPIRNFVLQFTKFLPFEENEIERGLSELIFERVLKIEDDYLVCKRMIKDNSISFKRAEAGKKGGEKSQFAKAKDKAKIEANAEIEIDYENEFNVFRKLYPGTKRGNETEFENFIKKHKDWKEVIPILYSKLKQQIEFRNKKESVNQFVPDWKHLQTWINQRCWEEELPEVSSPKKGNAVIVTELK
jgi:hypothetical protein